MRHIENSDSSLTCFSSQRRLRSAPKSSSTWPGKMKCHLERWVISSSQWAPPCEMKANILSTHCYILIFQCLLPIVLYMVLTSLAFCGMRGAQASDVIYLPNSVQELPRYGLCVENWEGSGTD